MRIRSSRSLVAGLISVTLAAAGLAFAAPAFASTGVQIQPSITESDVGGPVNFQLGLEATGPDYPTRDITFVLRWDTAGGDAGLRDVYVTDSPTDQGSEPQCAVDEAAATATCTDAELFGGVGVTVTGIAVDTDGAATASNGYSVTLDGTVAASGTWQTGEVPATVPTGAVQRVSGSDRYATSVALAKTAFPSKAGVVFLATGENFPDALSAGPAAAHEGAPLLLTASDSLPSEVGSEIAALRPYRVVIVGGTAAVSPAVAAEVHAVAPDATIDRLAGTDRYATNRLVIADAYPAGATVQDLYVTTGQNYPDALSAGAATGLDGALLLVPGSGSTVDDATKALIIRLTPTENIATPTATIVGGPAVLSSSLQGVLEQLGSYPRYTWSRVAGADRYVTSELLARQSTTRGFAVPGVYMASGTDFPDALVASAVAGPVHEPLLLTERTCVPDLTREAIVAVAPTSITLVGGTSALADSVGTFARC